MTKNRCATCGKMFDRDSDMGRPPKYCGNCRKKASSYKPVAAESVQCGACGDFFERRTKRRRFCSGTECRRRRERERDQGRDRSDRDYSYKKQAACDTCGEPTWGKPGDIVICHPCRRKHGPPVMSLEELRLLPPDKGDGLGWRHQRALKALRRDHVDGSPCDWCGRPMWLDPTRNYDYDPEVKRNGNGVLQGDHMEPRREYLKRGEPTPLPDRLLHAECNRQRGDGKNDHLAWVNRKCDCQS
ncbi:HNH endonuclease [Mycobacterium phage Ejimix]|uniref:HNH endonuclease n=2 Tax=Omegavirus courthouse TaxID=1089119 RepID=A0A2D2W3T0_9CAUD|nr:HNH endonuclease [Mycobacterium phage Wanda]YP_009123954.1 HNH endonuclease [Mycobacterium phage Minerva]ATN89717.1 HNH endonuclease [Mycobacterium phage Klein]ATS92844.1 HNH endonuclease [Mycobacterium phage Superphikiman]AXQ52005.1 HNH endonuclease [Mycobacterium phage Ejimix]QBI98635.1 HNH endonuclease [Mycobacterium phage Bobby]QDM55587.1 HNH endonuclease [Mycobacterium phage HokkenD]QDM57826.1 HNH endonuclease [Mycobacterium phage NihilNomen]